MGSRGDGISNGCCDGWEVGLDIDSDLGFNAGDCDLRRFMLMWSDFDFRWLEKTVSSLTTCQTSLLL